MDICSGGFTVGYHDEVVYECQACPMCQALIDIKRKEFEIKNLEKELTDAKINI